MKMIKVTIALIVLLFSTEGLFSQYPPVNTDSRDPRPEWKQRTDDDRYRHDRQIKAVVDRSRSINAKAPRTETPEQRKAAEAEQRRALEEINSLLSAPPEYRVRYAEFLKSKNTGLVRVFPDRGCDKGIVVDVKDLERCGETAPIKGAGSLFSFRLNKLPERMSLDAILYLIGESDIHFIDGKFAVGTESIQDIIGDIGEVELDQVTLKSESIQFLRSFKPGDTAAKVELQNQDLAKGVTENGYLYSTSAKVQLNRTYVLRSIAYSLSKYPLFWNTDVLTAFKVVGQENDGSVVILWKELKESKAPFLKK